ncbi:hypothetical protein [Azonexus sp.]|jgi:hypothetical protein|uniref:hypothetical protein n=1 Tax=Azonexus sp. TaxID=1872668 RepID=UPI00282660B6|nr:hypothetical protein [Azonexus sp.]MDR1995414.1 hypothetical protein [Azonexus sp.]
MDGTDRLSWHAIPKKQKTQLAKNANWAVPVLAAFITRPQSELKSARLAEAPASTDDTGGGGKSQ